MNQTEQPEGNAVSRVVVFEACASAICRAREMTGLGHEVRSIAQLYVRRLVERQKNVAAAEAIAVAARRTEIGLVMPKTAERQARAVMLRGRDPLLPPLRGAPRRLRRRVEGR